MANFNEFRLWKKDKMQEYLRNRGLPPTGNKEELVALAFSDSASYFFELNLFNITIYTGCSNAYRYLY